MNGYQSGLPLSHFDRFISGMLRPIPSRAHEERCMPARAYSIIRATTRTCSRTHFRNIQSPFMITSDLPLRRKRVLPRFLPWRQNQLAIWELAKRRGGCESEQVDWIADVNDQLMSVAVEEVPQHVGIHQEHQYKDDDVEFVVPRLAA